MALVAAVGTDTYNGLSGYKRPLAGGNPTRVPANLPAFRGTTNTPGSNVKAPAIKSSANHPDRKTNVCIPYARQVPLQISADLGRVQAGDLVFVSRDRPGIPGYAHCRFTRLAGVDALNKWMGPNFWSMRTDDNNAFRYISVDNSRIADDWRKVPFLAEWTLDGVVLSNEEREAYYNDSVGAHSGQMFNIAIQGPCMMNNGFVDREGNGQPARQSLLFAPGYMDHRVERIGQDKVEVDQSWDFQANYQGPQYHLYPLQMFDRNIRPMNELFCGLVAHLVVITTGDWLFLLSYVAAEEGFKAAEQAYRPLYEEVQAKKTSGEPDVQWLDLKARYQASRAEYALKREDLSTIKGAGGLKRYKQVNVAITAYRKMGWWDEETTKPKASPVNGPAPKTGFHYFQWVLFTSAHAWELDTYNPKTNKNGTIDVMAPAGEPPAAKRTKRDVLGTDPFDDFETRREHFTKMVGAWRIGKVLDMKAGKMPFFEGGPVNTGYRVTTDVEIAWWDWRKLRRAFTTNPETTQFCEAYEPVKFQEDVTAPTYKEALVEHERIFLWPTKFEPSPADGSNVNVPINPDAFYKGNDVNVDDQAAVYRGFQSAAKEFAEEADFDEDLPVSDEVSAAMFGDSPLVRAIRDTRAQALSAPPGPTTTNDVNVHIARASAGIAVIKALFASPSKQEIESHVAKLSESQKAAASRNSIATFVQAASAATAAAASSSAQPMDTEPVAAQPSIATIVAPTAPTASTASTAPLASIRRKAGNTPEPSPDRTGAVMLAAPTAGAAAATETPTDGPANEGRVEPASPSLHTVAEDASPVAEEPVEAPAPKAAPRRSRGSAPQADVFSSIFGGSDTGAGLQPLNPAHRADASGSGATGRSFQRRGKGKDKDAQ